MSELAVRFENAGKMYKIFPSRRDNLRDAVGIPRLIRRSKPMYTEFWALRGIDLELSRGARIGIIGRNGAGKSTLLKLVTGNLPPTEGSVEVRGTVQALLEIGGGLHPEFTGRENIHASLGLLGLTRAEIESGTADIARFTELGRFLDQPFKTYSMGMQARLSLGIATTVEPEILIIDEVLGAGDSYFFAKSTARMQQLLESGAAVLLVSHALDQIVRFCDETIWLDRGRIVMRGATREVVKAYERFTRELDSRRLRAKNQKARVDEYDSFARDSYTDHALIRFQGAADIAEVALLRDGEVEDEILVGAPQDADVSQSVHILGGGWDDPALERSVYYRKVANGDVLFNLWFLYPGSRYDVRVRYRAASPLGVASSRAGATAEPVGTLSASREWTDETLRLQIHGDAEHGKGDETTISRWTGSASFVIDEVRLLSAGDEQEIFNVGTELAIEIDIRAGEDGRLPLIPAALIFSADGIVATRHVAELRIIDVRRGDVLTARLDLGGLMLGNGTYVLSVGLYGQLDPEDIEPPLLYDYLDKSFEFRVVGNPKLHNELFMHPGTWNIEQAHATSLLVPTKAIDA